VDESNHNKALAKVINSILGSKIANVVLEGENVGFTLTDGRKVWVKSSPTVEETGWLKVEKK
jgi:hypothetical protein